MSCEAVDEFFTGENDVYISLEQNYFFECERDNKQGKQILFYRLSGSFLFNFNFKYFISEKFGHVINVLNLILISIYLFRFKEFICFYLFEPESSQKLNFKYRRKYLNERGRL